MLKQILTAWSEGNLPSLLPIREACERYSVEPQAVALTQALERLLASTAFVPSLVDIPPSLRDEIKPGNLLHRAG